MAVTVSCGALLHSCVYALVVRNDFSCEALCYIKVKREKTNNDTKHRRERETERERETSVLA